MGINTGFDAAQQIRIDFWVKGDMVKLMIGQTDLYHIPLAEFAEKMTAFLEEIKSSDSDAMQDIAQEED